MKNMLLKSTIGYSLVIAASTLLLLIFCISFFSQHAQAASTLPTEGRLITVHDQGQDRSIITRATTLREAFKEADIRIDPNDLVEPNLDETLSTNNYEVNIYRARPVTIVDGSISEKVMSPYQTPKQIADQAGITLHDEDTATITANTDIVSQGPGVQMVITRATPFTLVLYGTSTQAYTQEKTVGDMLKKKDVKLAKDDTLSVPLGAPIQAGMTVELWRNGVQTATDEEDIPFDIQKVQDADQPVGYKQVQTTGAVGKKTVTYEIVMKNGQEVSRQQIQSVVIQQPITEVDVVGTKMTNTFSGSFADALSLLRQCEAGGVYTRDSGNGYYGAYQYNISTWADYDGYGLPSDAPPSVQDEKAWLTYQARGWQPWPSCSRSQGLQDVYR